MQKIQSNKKELTFTFLMFRNKNDVMLIMKQ